MYDNKYITEKLTMAMFELATGQGDARSRIDVAYHTFWHIKDSDFPDNLKKTRLQIDQLITRLPAKTGYIIPYNIANMKNKTASKIAALIIELYLGIKEHETI